MVQYRSATNRSAVRPGTSEIAARQPSTRNVELARDPGRNRLQPTVQDISPGVAQRSADRDAPVIAIRRNVPGRIGSDFRRAIQIDEAAARIRVHEAPQQIASQDLPLRVQVESSASRPLAVGSLASVAAREGTVIRRVTCVLSMTEVSRSGSRPVASEATTSRAPVTSGPRVSNIELTNPSEVF